MVGMVLCLSFYALFGGTHNTQLLWHPTGRPSESSLTFHPIVESVKREAPGFLLNCWCTWMIVLFVDHFLTFCSALDIINMNGPSHGLFLYRSKGVLVVSAEASCEHSLLPPEIPVSAEGFCLLGFPFGFSSFYIFYSKKISEDS